MNQFVPFRKHRRMSGAQKSAILFLCLGEERGGALMQKLDVPEIRQITTAISTMGEVDASVVEEIMVEFGQKVSQIGGVVGSIEAARGLLKEFLPEERVAEILQEIDGNTTDNVWRDLSDLDEKQLVEFLRKEHNQTVAVILSRIRPDAAAKVLPLLGADRATDLIERVMEMDNLPNDTIMNIENTLRDDVLAKAGRSAEARVEGQLVSIFNKLDEDLFGNLSRELEERQPDQFRAIKQKMFVFDDLMKFEPVTLGKIMREVSGNTLPLALRGAKKEVREHFLESLPSRSRGMLQEEMESMGPVKSKDVKQAQSELVEGALRLVSEGVVEMPDEGEDMMDEAAE
ncbi:flagellar motor switch protein FliG [Sulfitobacter mediterraneus]|jgi:flagellar motor switch protein FliG|uniref:Flagellar motor switch protein FliG n=1 Tax=Sulfitobacter mediterraneus TaxID=83219 RepID=A0A2T6CA07_9RHOB|nr:flagellar motor switch protein FliG [Sulfitobacter mediterraneus]KIN77133.1 Flagellar motor protein [Sulfitobacter mediterraneus KCTC 32188]PTX65113.1 flagellar motor switch protein FliG [Sulfitobacter mediterraneus]